MTPVRLSRWMAPAVALVMLAAATAAWGAPASRRSAKAATPDSMRVLVRIGKTAITQTDVQRRIRMLPEQFRANYSTPEGRKQLLERMVEEQVWLAEALRQGVQKRPEVQDQLEQQRRDLLIRTYVSELMTHNPAVTDSEAQAYYDAHRDDYTVPATVTLSHIETRDERTAQKVRRWADRWDWNKLVKQYSVDSLTKANNGSLGTVTHDGVFATLGTQPALAESAFAIGEGKIGGPYKTDHGWQVIRVDAVKEQSVRPFAQVRQAILRQLGSQRSQEYYKTQLDEARHAIGVRADSSAIDDFLSQKRTAREMFNDAQTAGGPEQRIEAYRKMLTEYPDSEVSPQAQFMIGFIYSEELKKYDDAEKAFRELLKRYPKAELVPSAHWMLDHMRDEDAPTFIDMDADSLGAGTGTAKGGTHKP